MSFKSNKSNKKFVAGASILVIIISLIVLAFFVDSEFSSTDSEKAGQQISADFTITKTNGSGSEQNAIKARIICPQKTAACAGLAEALSDTVKQSVCKEHLNRPHGTTVSSNDHSNDQCTKVVIQNAQIPINLNKEIPKEQACTMIHGGPEVYYIEGSIGGRFVDFKRTMDDGCNIDEANRWDKLLQLALESNS